jgi:ATP-binding cassette subfamily F protein uup
VKARAAPARIAAAPTKLSYKDERRLAELEAGMPALAGQISMLEARLADADFYARDAVGFHAVSTALDKARADLAAAEDAWLALEERREALAR